MYTITRAYLSVLAQALEASGTPLEAAQDALASNRRHIRLATVYQWLQALVQKTENPDIGLNVYAQAHPAMLGLMGYAVMSSSTLGEALQRLVTYHPLTTNGSCLLIERQAGKVKLIGFDIGPCAPRVFIDAGFAMTLGLLHWLSPASRLAPMTVELSYPEPAQTQHLEGLLGSQLKFSAPYNSITFPEEICDLPILTAAPALDGMLAELADAQLMEIIAGSVAVRVRGALSEQLTQSLTPTLTSVAHALRMSNRTLQHALVREGVNFSTLLDEARLTMAHRLLRGSFRSLKYISATLGFRDQSSFHKACLRWFDMPPGQYRAQGV